MELFLIFLFGLLSLLSTVGLAMYCHLLEVRLLKECNQIDRLRYELDVLKVQVEKMRQPLHPDA